MSRIPLLLSRLLFSSLSALVASLCLAAEDAPTLLPPLGEPEFQRKYDEWKGSHDDSVRVGRAREMFFRRGMSTAQVRRLAQSIVNEDSRVEFVVAAYPSTMDPENFYEVYDAFQSFSRVFRMHDRIKAISRVPSGPVILPGPQPLTSGEFGEIAAALRQEAFDNRRLALFSVIAPKARERISTAQVSELLDLYSFENNRLEAAKIALHWVRDPENLYRLAEKFSFPANKDQLTQAIAARNRVGGRRPR